MRVNVPNNKLDRNEQEMISLFSTCDYCKGKTTIQPHKPIHTWAYMLQNWTYIVENIFVVSGGYCSRQCEQSAKK